MTTSGWRLSGAAGRRVRLSAGRVGVAALAAVLTAVLLVVNLRLYAPAAPPEVVAAQLAFLRAALRDDADEDMQALFPEGRFFTSALYGLAWVNVGLDRPALRDEALREARWARDRMDTPPGRAPFSPALDPPYGVFHAGWSAWLAGGILLLQPEGERPPAEVAAFARRCAALAAALERSGSPFLPAYPGQSWPVDSTVAVAALRLHDVLLAPRFQATVERWLGLARARLDPATGLLGHRAELVSGAPLEGARGSSQSLVAWFLVEIDPELARVHYARFRDAFVTGVPAVREYPRGVDGGGDIDSGPLIAGLSASASTVTLGTARVHGDEGLARALEQAAEAAGLPVQWAGGRRYAFGVLPVGDAFLAWSRSARPWVDARPEDVEAVDLSPAVPGWWRLPWHAATLLLTALIWLPTLLLARRAARLSRAA